MVTSFSGFVGCENDGKIKAHLSKTTARDRRIPQRLPCIEVARWPSWLASFMHSPEVVPG